MISSSYSTINNYKQLFKKIPVTAMNDFPGKQFVPHCPICHQEYDLYYKIPKIVPKCGHSFCEKCILMRLTVKVNRKVFVCPECSCEVVIRKNVGEDVPRNEGIVKMIKTLKKYSFNQWEEDKKQPQVCAEHNRPLELICQTCKYKACCSHCALFGSHKNHSFVKERPASQLDLSQLKDNFEIVTSSVQQFLLPYGQNNIKQSMKKTVTEGLRKHVVNSFKQYYTILQKKEFELIQQCDNIVINEGGIDKNIDEVLQIYDRLKHKFDSQFKMYTDMVMDSGKSELTVEGIEQFIAKCHQLHGCLQNIEKHSKEHINKIVKDIGIHISQATMFKIQQLPFSIKKVVESMNSPVNDMNSPSKRSRMKSMNNSDIKSKNVVIADLDENKPNNYDRGNRSQQKGRTSVIVKTGKDSFSNYDNRSEKGEEIQFFQKIAQSQIIVNKEQPRPSTSKVQHKSIERGSLPPKSNHPKNIIKQAQTIPVRPPKDDPKIRDKKSIEKELNPARTVNLKSKTSVVMSEQGSSSLPPQQLKFTHPTRQIPFQFRSKFQELTVQIDRQSQMSTLELNSKEINDILLTYVIDYIIRRKYVFQVIKLVKNSITDEGMRLLLGYLSGDKTTEVLNMTNNQLTPKTLDMVIAFANRNNILKTLYLSNNTKISGFQLKSRRGELDKHQFQIII